jgi:hypothetical protein
MATESVHAHLRPPVERQMISPAANRLLSLVFLAAVLPLLGIYGLLMKVATPSITGGMEPTVTTICYIAFTVITAFLSVVLINFSRQCARQAKGQLTTP